MSTPISRAFKGLLRGNRGRKADGGERSGGMLNRILLIAPVLFAIAEGDERREEYHTGTMFHLSSICYS